MKREFISNIGYLVFLNLLIKPFWILGIDRSVQNTVGPETYGLYFSLFNFSYLFQVILDFGINNYNNRNVARHPEKLASYFATTFLAKCLFAIAYTVLVFLFAFGVKFSTQQISLLMLMIIMQILLSFYTFVRSNIAALHLFKTDSVLSVLDKLIAGIICGLFLWGKAGNFTIETYIYAQISGYAMACIAGMIIILRRSKINMQFNRQLFREIVKNSFPFALLTFLMTVYYRIDAVMIERMLGDSGQLEAGIYASGYRLLDACNILGFMFAALLLPMFSRMLEQKTPVQPLVDLTHNLMLIASSATGITFIIYRNEIMQALYTEATPYYADIFGWLMVSFICISMVYIYGTLLTANGSLSVLNKLAVGGMLLNILLNIFLIPLYHALGAAIATVITQVCIIVLHVIISYRVFKLRFYSQQWLSGLGLLAGMTGFAYLSVHFTSLWYLNLLLSLCGGLFIALLLRLITVRNIVDTFRIYFIRS